MLTESQIAHFRTFGFVVLPNLFSDAETKTMAAEFEAGRQATMRYDPSIGTDSITQWSNIKPEAPFIAGMLEDQRFCSVAEQLFGKGFVGAVSNSNRRGGDTAWHPDHGNPNLRAFKFTTYLQPLRSDTGALRVIPGSHFRPFHNGIGSFLSKDNNTVNNVPAYSCETNPGDVIAFDMLVYHAAYGGSQDRCQLTLSYLGLPRTHDEEIATQELSKAIVQVYRTTFAPKPHHHPNWLANPDGSLMRQHWVNKLLEWGIVD